MRLRTIGMISGTSFDAIELAVADLDIDGDVVTMVPVGAASADLADDLRRRIAAVLPPHPTTIGDVAALDADLGRAFAAAAARAARDVAGGSADLVVTHGQTVFHWVEGGRARGTLQLGNPSWIAEATGLPVVSDLRNRDIAAGGQGAPLVSILDEMLVIHGDRHRGALNLGGIANITVNCEGSTVAYDVGPANALMDAAVAGLTAGQRTFDVDGEMAARGDVRSDLLDRLLAEPYYRQVPPKSTGKELFHAGYLDRMLADLPAVAPDDLLATLAELTARTVADACLAHGLSDLVCAGGGVRNPVVMRRLAALAAPCRIRLIEEYGIASSAKEAYAFALLGYLTVHGIAGTLPGATGAPHGSILGSLTPGARGWTLPAAAASAPTRLVVTAR